MTVNKHIKNCQTEINVSTHHQNLPTMWTEMFKIYMGTTPEILIELISFKLPSNYNLRCQPDFSKSCFSPFLLISTLTLLPTAGIFKR